MVRNLCTAPRPSEVKEEVLVELSTGRDVIRCLTLDLVDIEDPAIMDNNTFVVDARLDDSDEVGRMR